MSENEQVALLKGQQAGIVNWAQSVVVSTKEEADFALSRLQDVKTWRKRWVEYWRDLKENAAKAHKDICAKEKEGTEPIDRAEMMVKGKVIDWQRAEQAKAEAEQRRLQAIADEQARKERERLEAQAAKLKTPEKQAERLEQAASIVAPVVTVAPDIKTAGSSITTTWKAELVSLSALSGLPVGDMRLSFLVFDQSGADKFAKATKGTIKVPGVKFVPVQGLSVRSR